MGPKLNRDWIGLRVRLQREATNGYMKIPAGVIGVVDGYSAGRKGIRLESDPCEHCGVAVMISGMQRHDFEILTPVEEWPDTRGKGRQ